jgi:ABC-type multidrug transport system ATPase subunit
LTSAAAQDDGECLIRFDLDAEKSHLVVGGTVTSPITIPITMDNDTMTGLYGSLYVEVATNDGACPTDGQDILTSSEEQNMTLKFVAPPEAAKQGSLRVYPNKLDVVVKLGVTVFAELSFYDVSLEILTYEFKLQNDAATNSSVFNETALWRVVEGTGAAVSSVLGPGGEPTYVDLAGLNTTVQMVGSFDFDNRRVTLHDPITATFDLKDGDIADGVTASVFFNSKIEAEGVLNCPDTCMFHGKCIPLTPNSTEDFGCLCECGWSGADCSTPTGFCDSFPNANEATVIYQSAGETPETWSRNNNNNQSIVDELLAEAKALDPSSCTLSSEDCIGNSFFNDLTCSCECQVGWTGSNCSMCTNNAGCQIMGLGKECDTTLAYSNRTAEKNYNCRLRDDDPVRKFLEGDIRANCLVDDKYCLLRMGSYSDFQPHIFCNITECEFTDQSGHVNCNDLRCGCAPDLGCPAYFAPELIEILEGARNIKTGVLCDQDPKDGWVCEVAIEGLPVTVEGLCTQGTCLTGDESVNVAQAPLENVSPPGLLLALIGILAGVALCVSAFFISTNLRRWRMKRVLSKHGRYGGSAVSNLLLPGSTFSWSNIRCTLAVDDRASRSVTPLLGGIFHKRKPTDQKVGFTIYNNPNGGGDSMRASMQKMRSQRSHGANHCSLEKFPDGVHTLRAMSDSDLFGTLEESEDGQKTILHGITGTSQKGLVMAIMGPSGSGKSTLLNILAGGNSQISNCRVSGLIQVDSQARDQWFHKIAAHVPQEDNQVPTLTVRECIMYSAMLRLPWHWDKKTKTSHVDQVLKELGLKHVSHSQVGGSHSIRGVSGGERRRVSIGMELVTSPKILFLDEPTSGLDSYTAASIMSTLTRLARNGRMVFLSLHQPSEAVFKELDKVLLLAKGHTVYCGDTAGISSHFSDLGFPCPPNSNIADHILEVVSKSESCVQLISKSCSRGSKDEKATVQIRIDRTSLSDQPGEESERVTMDIVPITRRRSKQAFEVDMTPGTKAVLDLSPTRKGNLVAADSHQPLDRELVILFWRTWTDIWRHPALLKLHVAVSVLVGAACAVIFQNVPNDLAGMQNRAGCIFFTLTFFAFSSLTSIDLFIAERSVFTREIQGSYYRVGTYFFAKATLDGLLLRVLPAVLYSLIVYWSIGLRTSMSHSLVFFATLALFNLSAGSLSMVIATVSPTAGFASLATIVVLLIGLLFGGFLANADALPPWLAWMQYLSIFYYGFEILFVNEVHGLEVQFDAAGMDVNVKGDLFLDTFNFSVDDLPRDIVCLFGIYVGLLIAAYLLLWVFYSSSDVKVKANAKRSMKWYEKIGKKFSRPTKKGNKMDVSTQSLQK